MPIHPSPDKDELYQRLLPTYYANIRGNNGLYSVFAEYYDAGKSYYSAGEAMQKTLMEFGLIPLENISYMKDGAEEYEEIMSLQDLMEREAS